MKLSPKIKLRCLIRIAFAVLFCFSNFCFKFNFQNNDNFASVKAVNLELTETDIINLASFDSRDYGWVTPVKDQGDSSLCWAYAAVSASETSILKSGIDKNVTKDTLSLSAKSIGYGRYNRPADPLENVVGESGGNWLNSSGESSYAGILMSQWWGLMSDSLSVSTNAYENNSYKLNNMIKVYDDNTFYDFDTRISEMKKAIAKYGAITFSYNNLREAEFYNPKRETGDNYYFHACTIIGWNDDIDASNFVPSGTVKNGGWLVKNSYSSLPYFWLSYECVSSNIYAFDFSNHDKYDYNYFYDDSVNGGLTEDLKTQYVANIFEPKKSTSTQDEYLKAVNVAFGCWNTTVTVNVYTNLTDSSNPESGILKTTKIQSFTNSGFYTIEFDNLIQLKSDEKFSIVVQLSSTTSSSPYVSTSQGNGLCYRKINGNWSKINNNTLRIKAYTILGEKQDEQLSTVDLQNVHVSSILDCGYTGFEIRPNPLIFYNDLELIQDVDYTCSYSNNINASSFAKITITGKGNFKGQREVYFTINKAEKPNVVIPEIIENLQNYKTLYLINLPDGFVWKNPDFELKDGDNEVWIEYDNDDKNNYEIVNFVVKVEYKENVVSDDLNKKPEDDLNDFDMSDENFGNDDTQSVENDGLTFFEIGLIIEITCVFGGFIGAGTWFFIRKLKNK